MVSLNHEMTVAIKIDTKDIETSEVFTELVRKLVREELEQIERQEIDRQIRMQVGRLGPPEHKKIDG